MKTVQSVRDLGAAKKAKEAIQKARKRAANC